MSLRKLLKIFLAFLFLFAVVITLTSINHPIILKWVTGTAKHHGASIPASVYTNGQLNDQVKVFYTDEANTYLVYLPKHDSSGTLKFIYINLDEKWIGRPTAASKKDYDLIGGHLFQSETGGQFTPFQDEIKGFGFDPQLVFSKKQIQFNMPPGQLKIDSIRIELD